MKMSHINFDKKAISELLKSFIHLYNILDLNKIENIILKL